MNVQMNLCGSKKAKVDSARAAKFRKVSGRRDVVRKCLKSFDANVSSLGTMISFDDGLENFEFILNNIRNSINLKDKEKFINEAERVIDNYRRNCDRVLSDSSLTTEDRSEIKKTRDALILDMNTRLEEASGFGNSLIEEEQEIPVIPSFKLPEQKVETENRKEENVSMSLENGVKEDLISIESYEDYIFAKIMEMKNSLSDDDFNNFIRLVIEYFTKGNKIIGVLTLEEFIDLRREQIENARYRALEEEKRGLEREYIDTENELRASTERGEMLARQRDDYSKKASDLRLENNALTQQVSEQQHDISGLNERVRDLSGRVDLDNANIAKQQKQIFELQRRLDSATAARNQGEMRIRELEGELFASKGREAAAEDRINELNESTKRWRDNLSKELKKLSPSDDSTFDNENSANIDLDKLSKGFEELNRVMREAGAFDDSVSQVKVF